MTVRILTGDCLDLLPTLDSDSIDAVCTDPPYGLGFMGREWDTFRPDAIATRAQQQRRKTTKRTSETYPHKVGQKSQGGGPALSYDESTSGNQRFQVWTESWARECLRVLKPGGHMLVFGGPRTYHRLTCGIEDAGFEVRDCLMWLHGQGFPKSHNLAGEWDGWGTALKPGWEPIILARKPLIGTVAANVLEHGTGALNIDGCRLSADGNTTRERTAGDRDREHYRTGTTHGPHHPTTVGRWPANVVLDEVAVVQLDQMTGKLTGGVPSGTRNATTGFSRGITPGAREVTGFGDTGGASRFFYVAKASRSDRGEGNTHPTVKNTSLMRWLVRLITPPGGIVLDPFAGSGTTGVAAVAEGFDCILMEREAEYVEMIERRTAQRGLPLDGVA